MCRRVDLFILPTYQTEIAYNDLSMNKQSMKEIAAKETEVHLFEKTNLRARK